MRAKVEFSSVEYRRSHGAEPRGRGSWGFCPAGAFAAVDYLDHVWWAPANLTLSEAKKAAAEHFAGFSLLIVCP